MKSANIFFNFFVSEKTIFFFLEEKIGKHFLSDFLLPFELASVLLLMAMVGAIVLARRDFIPDTLVTEDGVSNSLQLPERLSELESRELSAAKSSDS